MKKYVPAAAGASNVALNASSDVRAPSVLSMASTPVGRATRSPGTAYRTLPGSACRRAASTSPSHGRKEQRGNRRDFVGRADENAPTFGDALGGAENDHRIAHKWTRARQNTHCRRCADPQREVP